MNEETSRDPAGKFATRKWTFAARFRRHAFGWKSQPAIKRIQEAVREIKKEARSDPVLAAEGAVLFLEKVSPAIEQVDSSSGAIGTAVNHAIRELASIIGAAPADDTLREKWLQRLWQAIEEDSIPYLELLAEHWGELCATKLHASRWADEFIDTLRLAWTHGGWFKGTYACLGALFKAERYDELFELIERDPLNWWSSRHWGVKALAAQGKKAEAIAYAEATDDTYANPSSIARECEDILLSDGKTEEAYSRYALQANRKGTHLATFRAVASKYPDKEKAKILRDLVAQTPGEEGKWFAAAKTVGLYDEAIILATASPCDPKTLTRAVRDFESKNPLFAMEAGLAALHWLLMGHGYDITAQDVASAYRHTMIAAANAESIASARSRIAQMLDNALPDGMFWSEMLRRLQDNETTPERNSI